MRQLIQRTKTYQELLQNHITTSINRYRLDAELQLLQLDLNRQRAVAKTIGLKYHELLAAANTNHAEALKILKANRREGPPPAMEQYLAEQAKAAKDESGPD